MNLKEKFSELLANIGFLESEIEKNWLDLEKAYSNKSRHHHNLTHINDMLECFEIYVDQLQSPNEVLFSIFYHDYIYKSSNKDMTLNALIWLFIFFS